jgi:predicted enzyme related to lactoylglutathione lyase
MSFATPRSPTVDIGNLPKEPAVSHRETAPVGAPCWVDIFSSDPDRTRTFYSELFGWKAEEPNAEFGGYWMFFKDGVQIAGGMRNDGASGAPDGWSVYLATEDAATTVDQAAARGAQVIVPVMPIADMGAMAVISDPGGAVIGMWQPGAHKGFGAYDEANTPGWFELHTRDYDSSVAFYRDVFKWNAQTHSDTDEFRYTVLANGDEQLAGIMDAASFLPQGVPSYWSVYFMVDDTDAAVRRLEELGGALTEGPEDTPYGRLAAAVDSTGARFKLMAR